MRRDPEFPVNLLADAIQVDGQPLRGAGSLYLMLNKPRGLVTTASDEKNRSTIYDCLDAGLPWLGPVGRLDKASEGLLLLTNDSEWSAKIAAPESHLEKTYHVQITTIADKQLTEALVSGITTEDGDSLRAHCATLLRSGEKNSW